MKTPDEQTEAPFAAAADGGVPFRALVEQLPAMTYVVDLLDERKTVYVSPQVESLFGYTPAEWLADPDLWVSLIHEEDRERILEELREKNETGEPFFLEYRVYTRSGEAVWVRNDATYSPGEDGRPRWVHGVMLNITRRKRAEGDSHRLAHDLGERVKELSCLFGISKLVERPGVTLDEILQGIVDLIPASWQHPEQAEAELVVDERRLTTANFRETPWMLASPVVAFDRGVGQIRVAYLEPFPPADEGPFVRDERELLEIVAGRVGKIIERMRTEEELAGVRQRYEDLINNINVGIYRNTPGADGHFLEANPEIVDMFEAASKEEFLRHKVSEFYQHPEERERFSSKLLRDGHVQDEELQLLTLKGRPFWAAITAVRKTSADGREYFDGIVEDITARKEAEQTLHLQSAVLHAAANGIVVTDTEGKVVWVNKAFTDLTGYSAEEVIGENPRLLRSGKHDPGFYHDLWQTILNGEVWRGEIINRRKDGSLYSEDMTITPVKDENGRTLNYVAVKQDITDRILTEATMAQYARQLKERNTQFEEDLVMAGEIQQAILPQRYPTFPPSAKPEESALKFCHLYHPSGTVGGDFFDVLPLSDTEVGIFICDVMGHGMRAALVTAIVRGLTEELTLVADDPGGFLTELNRDFLGIFKNSEQGAFATAFYMVADVRSGEVIYSNAGHPSPLHISRRKAVVGELPMEGGVRGPALGLMEEGRYETGQAYVDVDDLLMLYTDGLCEVERPDREAYGEERLRAAIRERLALPAPQLFQAVFDDAKTFSEGQGFSDDVCLVGMDVSEVSNPVGQQDL